MFPLLISLVVPLLFPQAPTVDVRARFAEAEQLLMQGRFSEALTLIDRVTQGKPTDPAALHLKGEAYSGLEDWNNAAAAFAAALKLAPTLHLARRNLGICRYHLGSLEEAKEILGAYVKTAPADLVPYVYLGRIAMEHGRFSEAAVLLRKCGPLLERDPSLQFDLAQALFRTGKKAEAKLLLGKLKTTDPLLLFQVGSLLTENGFHDEAARALEKAKPGYPDAQAVTYNLALCYYRGERYPQASRLLEELVGKGMADGDVLGLLADVYIKMDRLREAYATLEKAIVAAPENKQHFVNLLSLCIDLEEYERGFPIVEAALKRYPAAYEFYMQRALLYCLRNQFDLAESDCRRAIELAPQNEGLQVGLATILMTADRLPETAEVLERLKQRSSNYLVLYLYAETLIRIGADPRSSKGQEAFRALRASVAANPSFPQARLALARIYRDLEQYPAALAELEAAVKLDPKNRACHYELYRLYVKLGQSEKAARLSRKLEEIGEFEKEDFYRRALVKQGLRQYAESP